MRKFPILFLISLFLILCSRTTNAESNWTKTSFPFTSVTSIENSPWGILAGEFSSSEDTIYISKDLGQTWESLGLHNRGVVDIKYFNGKLYAATYYVQNYTTGLFVSEDRGHTWNSIGPKQSSTKVDADSKTIYFGTEVYGLWISQDGGSTWSQKIGTIGDGTKIYAVKAFENIAFATTLRNTYKSLDHGNTWTEVTALSGKSIFSFCANGNVVFAGSSGTAGLYLSADSGNTWKKVESFGNYIVGDIIFYNNRFYVGRENPLEQKYTVYYTSDIGNTWVDTHLDTANTFDKTLELSWVYSEPAYLFAAVLKEGVFKYQIPQDQILALPIFSIPWQAQHENELIDKITSYFDHSYPLLGYNYFLEPEIENATTLNFLGIKDSQPNIYYSSHSGTDFALEYGTEIYAPAPGYASYYYCFSCGNTIKIDHLNGYESIYEHLQNIDLVTKNGSVWVNSNDRIGRVGLTGNTSGPHLHFEVIKDVLANGNFLDDFPMGRIDPFGWQDSKNKDPWKTFFWTDPLGYHQGSESLYLWKTNVGKSSGFLNLTSSTSDPKSEIVLENKKITFENLTINITAKITSYIQPMLSSSQLNLKYIENTSFIAETFDQLGNNISDFDYPVKFTISINPESLTNTIIDTIRLYYWNYVENLWSPLESAFDTTSNILTSYANHFSKFAVFGEKVDPNPPQTRISVEGNQINGWFTNFPQVTMSSYDAENSQIEYIFYSLDNGASWETYQEPFEIQKDGVTNLLYKARDINGNTEEEKSYVIQINITGKSTKNIKVIGSKFSASY